MHDHVLDVEIGVYTNEKGVTQRVRFSVDIDMLPAPEELDDDIGRAFDYDSIINGIKAIIARGHINLVETLAEEVAQHCLAHPRAARVEVDIEKLDKEPGAVGVEIVRSKGRADMRPPRCAPCRARAQCARRAANRGQARRQRRALGRASRPGSTSLRDAPRPVVVVPGGGALADEVRDCQRQLGFGDRHSPSHGAARHGSACLGHRRHAAGLRGRHSRSRICARTLERGLVAVWAP